jgi:hypothetical protein
MAKVMAMNSKKAIMKTPIFKFVGQGLLPRPI